MTDRPPDPSRDAPDRTQDAAVRALLGEARVTEPMPVEVADRLERALAAAPGPAAADPPAGVVRLRRRLVGGLVAAAVVVLGGGAIATQVHLSDGDAHDSAASGSALSKTAEDAGADGTTQSPAAGSREPALTPSAGPRQLDPLGTRARLPELSSASFAAEVRALVAAVPWSTRMSGRTPATDGDTPTSSDSAHGGSCTRPATAGSDADLREVSLDGRLATLLVDPPTAEPRHATAYSCDGARELATAVLAR
jgi:hypothetical protein